MSSRDASGLAPTAPERPRPVELGGGLPVADVAADDDLVVDGRGVAEMREREADPPVVGGQRLDGFGRPVPPGRHEHPGRPAARRRGQELGERVAGVVQAVERVRTQLEGGRRVGFERSSASHREELSGAERPDDRGADSPPVPTPAGRRDPREGDMRQPETRGRPIIDGTDQRAYRSRSTPNGDDRVERETPSPTNASSPASHRPPGRARP